MRYIIATPYGGIAKVKVWDENTNTDEAYQQYKPHLQLPGVYSKALVSFYGSNLKLLVFETSVYFNETLWDSGDAYQVMVSPDNVLAWTKYKLFILDPLYNINSQ